MMALNGWHTHCWRSEGRGEGMFPAGKAQEINKVSAPRINRIYVGGREILDVSFICANGGLQKTQP